MTTVTEPQSWVLIGLFATLMLGGMTVMTTLLTRTMTASINGLRGEMNGRFDGLRGEMDASISGLRAEMNGLRGEMNANFGAIGAAGLGAPIAVAGPHPRGFFPAEHRTGWGE